MSRRMLRTFGCDPHSDEFGSGLFCRAGLGLRRSALASLGLLANSSGGLLPWSNEPELYERGQMMLRAGHFFSDMNTWRVDGPISMPPR